MRTGCVGAVAAIVNKAGGTRCSGAAGAGSGKSASTKISVPSSVFSQCAYGLNSTLLKNLIFKIVPL